MVSAYARQLLDRAKMGGVYHALDVAISYRRFASAVVTFGAPPWQWRATTQILARTTLTTLTTASATALRRP